MSRIYPPLAQEAEALLLQAQILKEPMREMVHIPSFAHEKRRYVYRLDAQQSSGEIMLAFLAHEDAKGEVDVVLFLEGERQRCCVEVAVVARERAHVRVRALVHSSTEGHTIHEELRGLLSGEGAFISCTPEIRLEKNESTVTHAASLIPLAQSGYAYLCARGYAKPHAREVIEQSFLARL